MLFTGTLLSCAKRIPTSSINFCRQLSTSYRTFIPRGINNAFRQPALTHEEQEEAQMTAEELDELNNISMEDYGGLEKMSNRDILKYGEVVRRKTIEHKYFKEKGPSEPNLLTWAMKQQLFYLNATDPDYWTPQTLSLSFPISPDGVKRLLKNKRLAKNEEEIAKHDRSVVQRWSKLTNGKLGSSKLLEHAIASKLSASSTSSSNVPVICPSQDHLLETLESLRFEGDEKPFEAKQLRPKNKVDKYNKTQTIKSGSFASIITDYNQQRVNKNMKMGDKSQTMDLEKEEILDRISNGPLKYEGKYNKVCGLSVPNSKSNRTKQKYLTFEEFMSTKKQSSS